MSEISARASFEKVRYAQVWEDADTLLAALKVQKGDTVLSIASAGDNALALLTTGAARVVAIDLSAAQLSCLALRVAAFQVLSHQELLELLGSRHSNRQIDGQLNGQLNGRIELYQRCRPKLSPEVLAFWDSQLSAVADGIGGPQVGKFERYFSLFRRKVLPLMLSQKDIAQLLQPKTETQREEFYARRVDTWRWRMLFRVFFSRTVMGRLGRDPEFFKYVDTNVASSIQKRAKHALTVLDPSKNAYLQWIVTGTHGEALPLWLRPEHFETIKANLSCLEWHQMSLEDFLVQSGPRSIDRFNLSDIFEYMSEEATQHTLASLARVGTYGGRLVYWNMLAPRARGEALAYQLQPQSDEADDLYTKDPAFFYSRLVIEEILA